MAYEREASAAVAAASSPVELDDARVGYLGRKSELAQALRGVRDRESGMLLNGIRERLEAAVTQRERTLEGEELDRRLREEIVDVTLPGERLPLGHLHPITQVRRIRFRTHFFPFTEPSIEPDVSCGICDGAGCRTCKHTGWIEMGGAGVVDPQVFENVGVDPERWSGFAFGCGLERAAQLRHDIPDIRLLWEGDLRVLRQF